MKKMLAAKAEKAKRRMDGLEEEVAPLETSAFTENEAHDESERANGAIVEEVEGQAPPRPQEGSNGDDKESELATTTNAGDNVGEETTQTQSALQMLTQYSGVMIKENCPKRKYERDPMALSERSERRRRADDREMDRSAKEHSQDISTMFQALSGNKDSQPEQSISQKAEIEV